MTDDQSASRLLEAATAVVGSHRMQIDAKDGLGAESFGPLVLHGSYWDLHRRLSKEVQRGASCRLDSQGNVRFSGAAPSYAQLQQSNGALPAAAMYHNMLQQNGSMQPGRRVPAALLSAASTALLYLAVIEEDGSTYMIAIRLVPMQDASR